MAFIYTYTWDTSTSTEWTYTNPDSTTGLYTGGSRRRWNWDSNDTPSSGCGPTSGELTGSLLNAGYIYTEASSATTYNDQFIMENNTVFDTKASAILITFYTNQRGTSNNSTCELQTNESNAGWVTRATFGGSSDPSKVASNGVDIWALRTVDLSDVVGDNSTRIRLVVTMPSSGTVWHNDYGIDTFTIVGIDRFQQQKHQMII